MKQFLSNPDAKVIVQALLIAVGVWMILVEVIASR